MDFSLAAIWASMGLMARLVTFALGLMAVASLGVFFERLYFYFKHSAASLGFALATTKSMEEHNYPAVLDQAKKHDGSLLASLISAGLATFQQAERALTEGTGGMDPIELTRRALGRKAESQAAELRRGFGVLASVGSVAPFVGLFGTVVGIITAFEGIARTGSGGLGAVSAGIAEALVVTALGLIVAIPAVLAFNFLSGRADKAQLDLDLAAGELIDHLEQARSARDVSKPRPAA